MGWMMMWWSVWNVHVNVRGRGAKVFLPFGFRNSAVVRAK